jgi:lipopolysaccharide export system permease protein
VKDGQVIMHLERINPEFEFGALYMFRFNEDDTLKSIARAENSGIDDNDKWILENFRETRFRDDGVQVVESSVAVESFDVKKNDLSAERYETELWSRVSKTATVALMPVLALAFVFGSMRSTGSGTRLLVGVLIGLGYFLASEMIANSGQVFNLNPAVVTWLPSMVLLMVTALALSRVR